MVMLFHNKHFDVLYKMSMFHVVLLNEKKIKNKIGIGHLGGGVGGGDTLKSI